MIDLQLNNQSTFEVVFIMRLMYDVLAFNRLDAASYANPAGVKDFWKFENILYGKVSPSLAIIEPRRSALVVVPNQENDFFTFEEIAARFISFQNFFRIPSQSGRLVEDNYLNSPRIFQAFIDGTIKYNERITTILQKHNWNFLEGPDSS